MSRQLSVHTAEITTAAVQINTLTIMGKQVTLAVFRQLEETQLIADDGTLNGIPWGRVNYHPDKCADAQGHWHIVWQDGVELRRAYVRHSPEFDSTFSPPSADQFLSATMAAQLLGEPTGYWSGQLSLDEYHRKLFQINGCAGVVVWAKCDETVIRACKAREAEERSVKEWQYATESAAEDDNPSEYSARRAVATAKERATAAANLADALVELRGHMADLGAATQWYEKLVADVAAEASRRQRHRDVRAALGDLPQLFIAV